MATLGKARQGSCSHALFRASGEFSSGDAIAMLVSFSMSPASQRDQLWAKNSHGGQRLNISGRIPYHES